MDKLHELSALAARQATALEGTRRSDAKRFVRRKWALGRTCVEISVLVRSIRFAPAEKRRLIELVRTDVQQKLTSRKDQKATHARRSEGPTTAELKRILASIRKGQALSEQAKKELTQRICGWWFPSPSAT